MNKKGSVAVMFLALIVGMFIIAVFFTIFSEPINIVYNTTYGLLDNQTSMTTYNVMLAVWDFWPVAAFIGVIIAGFVVSQRSSEREVY